MDTKTAIKKHKTAVLFLLVLISAVFLAACGVVTPQEVPEKPEVKSITIGGKPVGIQDFAPGQTWQLSAAVVTTVPGGEADFTVVWKSENEKTATVDRTGLVVAAAPGITRISASAGGKEDSFELCLRGALSGIALLDKPAENEVFYTGEKKDFPYAPEPMLTDAFEVYAATSDQAVARVELNQTTGTLGVVAGLIKGDAVITVRIEKADAPAVTFSDTFIFKNGGEKPLRYDFDTYTEDMSYTARHGNAAITDSAAELPDGAASAKALTFTSSSENASEPGVEFAIHNSAKYGPAGNYRLSFKLKIISHSGGERLLVRLFDSDTEKADSAARKWELAGVFTAITDGATIDLPPQPAANRTFDKLFVGLDGIGKIDFVITDILWQRTPLTEITINNKPAGTIDLRTYANAAADEGKTDKIYRLGIANGGSDGNDYRALMRWSSDNDGVAAVDSNGFVTLKANGTAKITVGMVGTGL
ncbi:MAG: Ig-like domain-containing protein, partial [Clostridiales bacterium]|nr:Ig-like domain-containing protein [Clostridiales bacterium]